MNPFKNKLGQGVQIGCWQALGSPYTAEICAGAGFDWLLFDGEHGPIDVVQTVGLLQAVAPYPVEPIVRLPSGDPVLIKRYLDIGARTLLIPMVTSEAEAVRLARAMRYPPDGTRGVGAGLARASRWLRTPDYLKTAHLDQCLILQVENRDGLAALDGIAGTEGVDAVFIGPADLAADLGHLGNPLHSEVQAAVETAFSAIKRAGKAIGILASDEASARRYIEQGADFVGVGTDISLLARGAEALARTYKDGMI